MTWLDGMQRPCDHRPGMQARWQGAVADARLPGDRLCLAYLPFQVMIDPMSLGEDIRMILDWLVSATGAAIIGGGLVGLSAALLLVVTGRSMNLSEMIGSLLGGNEGLAAASIAFLVGLVIAPAIWLAFSPLPVAAGAGNIPVILVAGLLAGFGARLGSTGISGQAILGLARLSKRSLVAVICLLLGGVLGVTALGWVPDARVPS